MVTATLLASGLIVGVPWPVVALLALGTVGPLPVVAAMGALGAWVVMSGGPPRDLCQEEAVWLAGVAAELRAGASLRGALIAAADRVQNIELGDVVRLSVAGAPYGSIAAAVDKAMPGRRLVGPTLGLAGRSGGRAAAVLDRLAMRAWADVAAERQRRTLGAQARLSAWVVGGLPVAATIVLVLTGRLGRLIGSGLAGGVVLGAGLVLQLAGIAAVVVLLRRSPR